LVELCWPDAENVFEDSRSIPVGKLLDDAQALQKR
jgi:hypothetical protein